MNNPLLVGPHEAGNGIVAARVLVGLLQRVMALEGSLYLLVLKDSLERDQLFISMSLRLHLTVT